MKIVIDIPNSLYANLQKIQNGSIASKRLLDCVRNGTQLPKGHGALIDAEELLKHQYLIDDSATLSARDVVEVYDIEDAPTIVEADKEQTE